MSNYIKRIIKYILKGIPQVNITTQIVQRTPEELFKNKKILITGGGSGLGFYVAKKCAREGAEVVIVGRNETKLQQAIKELEQKISYMIYDVKKAEQADEFMQKVFEKYGKIDCLINNAGISLHEKDFKEVTLEGFESQIDTNLKGAYFLTQAYVKQLKENEKGNVIFISSERGAQCDYLPYGLTKIAINSLTEGLSRRYYKKGIRINAVAPGITASDMTNIDKDSNLYCDYNASGRYFMPEEVAEVVAFLVSDFSKCISGEVIYCDAGNHLNPWFKE